MMDHGRSRRTLLGLLGLLLLVPPLHALGTGRKISEFSQKTWQSDSGLPQNTVHAVLQTEDGFLWIGTEAGLVRFDGINFRVYDSDTTPGIRSGIINDLKQDSSGNLWISTSDGLLRERGGTFTRYSGGEGLPSNAVSATFLPRRGGVLALTSAGIAELRGERFELLPGTEELQEIDSTSSIAEAADGDLWIAGRGHILHLPFRRSEGSAPSATPARPITSKGTQVDVSADLGEIRSLAAMPSGDLWIGCRNGLGILRNGVVERATPPGGLPSEDIRVLLADGAGGLWIGTGRGLAFWKAGAITIPRNAVALSGAPIQRLYRDREAALWVATTRGIARVVDGAVDIMPRPSRLTGVLAIFEDREGSVWFGTDNAGLTVLREQAFSTVGEQQGLSAAFVRAIFQDAAGTIWIGTNGGGLNRIDHEIVSPLVSRPALSSDVVLSVAKTAADLWVGTPNGLNRVRNGVARVFTTEDGLPDDFVRSLFADRDGSLWIGTRNGLSHLVGERFTSYSKLDGLGSDLIGAILRTRDGTLWVGTLGGLSRMHGTGFQNATTANGLGSNAVTSLLEDAAGTVWIGTQNAGLTRLQAGRFTALPAAKTGLPETAFGMLSDASGDLWLSSRKGISRVSTSALDAFARGRGGAPAIRTYGTADGMRISEGSSGGHPAAWPMRDGSLWFATLDGAVYVTPESTAKNELQPPTVIEGVLLNDHAVDPKVLGSAPGLIVPPGNRRIEVQYAGLSFVAPQKVRYRYRLAGFDKDWIDAGARREAFYTNLPPGQYRFLVRSSNNDGVWSNEPAAFNLTVQPTLLQTRWFYALLALFLGALAFAVYRWRVHSVEAQYKAVLQERGRIAREIHDTLAQGYVAISVQLELTARLLQTSKEAALKQLDETKELVRGSLAEARSSIWNLRSQNEVETLPSLLAAMAQARSSSNGPAVKLDIQGTYRPVALPVEKEILRVAQEAVANAVQHARARHIHVTLRYDSSTLHLRVSDDGSGFTPPARDLASSGHFGLQGMRERSERIGAKLTVESTPGKGTTVDMKLDPRKAERESLL